MGEGDRDWPLKPNISVLWTFLEEVADCAGGCLGSCLSEQRGK